MDEEDQEQRGKGRTPAKGGLPLRREEEKGEGQHQEGCGEKEGKGALFLLHGGIIAEKAPRGAGPFREQEKASRSSSP